MRIGQIIIIKCFAMVVLLCVVHAACSSKGGTQEEADYTVRPAEMFIDKVKEITDNEIDASESLTLYHHHQALDFILVLGDYEVMRKTYEQADPQDETGALLPEKQMVANILQTIIDYITTNLLEQNQANLALRFFVLTDFINPQDAQTFYDILQNRLAAAQIDHPLVYINPFRIAEEAAAASSSSNQGSASESEEAVDRQKLEDIVTMLAKSEPFAILENNQPQNSLNISTYETNQKVVAPYLATYLRVKAQPIFIHFPTRQKKKMTLLSLKEIIEESFLRFHPILYLSERYDLLLTETAPQIYQEMIDEIFINYTQFLYLKYPMQSIYSLHFNKPGELDTYHLQPSAYALRPLMNAIQIKTRTHKDMTFTVHYLKDAEKMNNNDNGNNNENSNSNSNHRNDDNTRSFPGINYNANDNWRWRDFLDNNNLADQQSFQF